MPSHRRSALSPSLPPQVMPQHLKETSFWVGINEERLADDDILQGLQSRFSSRPVAKRIDSDGTNSKTKRVRSVGSGRCVGCNGMA